MALGLHRAIAQKVLASVIVPHLKCLREKKVYFGRGASGDFGT